MQGTNYSLQDSKEIEKALVLKSFAIFNTEKNWPGKKHGGVLKCRTRCDVLARQVKAMATWSDRAVYHAVLW